MLKNAIWLFILSIFVLFVFLPSYTRMQDLQKRNSDYEAQLEYLEQNTKELKAEVKRLKEDPEYLEKVAREKMGLIREGEVVYQITPVKTETP